MQVSIIVPVLNEAEQLEPLLSHLQHWRDQGCEIILVDGGSTDQTLALLQASPFKVATSPAGRAVQMNTGAQTSRGELLVFLHADTQLPATALHQLAALGQTNTNTTNNNRWGFFQVRIVGRSIWLKLVSWMMNRRSQWTGIATGDQALFINRELFNTLGGFPEQPLMEDIEICKRLRAINKPLCLAGPATTSGRRWDQQGVWRTIILMWRLRFAYWRGVSADELAQYYRRVR